jgi:hypothetical protein
LSSTTLKRRRDMYALLLPKVFPSYFVSMQGRSVLNNRRSLGLSMRHYSVYPIWFLLSLECATMVSSVEPLNSRLALEISLAGAYIVIVSCVG